MMMKRLPRSFLIDTSALALQGTSGLLVVAKREEAHRGLCEQFKARTVGREYLSIVLGVPVHRVGR